MKIEEMKANGYTRYTAFIEKVIVTKEVEVWQRIGTMPAPYLKRLLKHCRIQLLKMGNIQRFNRLNAVQNLRLLSPPHNQ